MSLRRRLVVAFGLLLLVALGLLSIIATRSTTRVLLAQADDDLRAVEDRLVDRSNAGTRGQGSGELDRRFATLTFDTSGALVETSLSGFADDPDVPPAVAEARKLLASPGTIATVSGDDRSIDYRAVAVLGSDGTATVVAVPVNEIGEATTTLVWWLVAGGVGVAASGAAMAWWIVRRGLRPVDDMVDTAAAIAAGDLSRRIPDERTTTELGRLGRALNDMLSQLDQAFAQEQAAQLQLNQFVADASHELRTPLAALQGYADLYLKGALEDPAELNAAMERIRKESGRMQRLVDDLLLLARLDRGQPLELRPINVVAIIDDAVADSQAIEPSREVTYDGPERLVVNADQNRLAQVFANLLANARAHTPANTPIHITATKTAEHVTFEVTDAGPGIPEHQLTRVFDRFSQADRPATDQHGGAGLGLAIVAGIVDAHDGTVRASNVAEGGARFTIDLPIANGEVTVA